MRFHVPCLPHTLPTEAYCHCAYSQKLRNFARMMRSLGHEVCLYESAAPLPPDENLTFPFDGRDLRWQRCNADVIEAMRPRVQPRDVLCLIGGHCQKPIADAYSALMAVEFGIGYHGVFAPYQVFESYWHMAQVYMEYGITRGRCFDAVIPNYYDPAEYPFSDRKEDYLLFVGRLNEDKGIHVAAQIAQAAGLPLVVAGQGTPPAGVDYRGRVGSAERGRLMAHARALLAPTLYLEPFGGVAVEAQLCGTPVITTDFGAFPETVLEGVTGFRCHYLGEFVEAVWRVRELDPFTIQHRAVDRYSLDVVKHHYQRYFDRLQLLWHDGWQTVQPWQRQPGPSRPAVALVGT